MPADIAFTPHSIERFIERHAPSLSMAEAERHLLESSAVRLRERTILGQLQYQIDNPRCVLVVKRDPRMRPDLICVTVLPDRENSKGWSEEEEAIRNEWLADQAEKKLKRDLAHRELLSEPSSRSAALKQPVKTAPPATPPALPKIELPRDPEQARIVANLQALALATSLEREREKTKRHEITERNNNVVLKRCLRIVLSDLVARVAHGDETALQISELVQQVRPEFLMGEFLRVETEGRDE